jgi:DNA polymerase-3 subunit epsilon
MIADRSIPFFDLRNMKLKLHRPLVIFDLETTGTSIGTDRIVEIALVKLMPDGTIHTKPEKTGPENRFLINPEMDIPIESSLVHGIYNDDVKDAPTFAGVADKLYKFMHDCDLGGFNSNRFDIPLLAEEFLRVGIDFSMEGRNLIDVQVIFHLMEQRTLKAGYKFYCGKDLDDAHAALPDAMATLEILQAQVDRYDGMVVPDGKGGQEDTFSTDIDKLHGFCQRHRNVDLAGRMVYNENNVAVFNFGKYKGMPVVDVLQKDAGYYGWMMQGDFPLYTKKVLSDLRKTLN